MKDITYINEKKVAEITGLALSTLRNARFRGELFNYYILGKRAVRYRYDEVIDYIESRKIIISDDKQ